MKMYCIILVLFLSVRVQSQTSPQFERYIDSLLRFSDIYYDSVNLENNIDYWLDFCLKNYNITEYYSENSDKNKIDINISADSLGNIINVQVSEKHLEKYTKSILIGNNFFEEFINKVILNGHCIPDKDMIFFNDYFSQWKGEDIPVVYSADGGSCGCH